MEQENAMNEPSSPPSEHLDADRAPLTEAIQLYQVEHAMLVAHQREVERRRAAVRAAAEQEASEILLAARREIRRVLVRTRHELVALTAQVRAAGCEAAPAESDQSIGGGDSQLSPARDVRNLLRDARSELLNLSRDPANLGPAGEEPQRLAPAVAIAPPLESAAAGDFWSPGTHQESSDGAEDFREEVSATGLTEQFVKYWRPAVALVILAVVATAIVALRPSSKATEADLKVRTAAALTTSSAGAAGSTPSGPAAEAPVTRAAATAPNASRAAVDASGTAGSEMLSLILEVRRP
ncbi:MAG TPA: hypothetical protein VFV49_04020, partial [Thermoanaerobaculia bacterium]|nr:hypothetical protein [Thermoanaerobaculia bacterium]